MADADDAPALPGAFPHSVFRTADRTTPDGPSHIPWLVMVRAATRVSNDGTTQPISLRIPVLSNETWAWSGKAVPSPFRLLVRGIDEYGIGHPHGNEACGERRHPTAGEGSVRRGRRQRLSAHPQHQPAHAVPARDRPLALQAPRHLPAAVKRALHLRRTIRSSRGLYSQMGGLPSTGVSPSPVRCCPYPSDATSE